MRLFCTRLGRLLDTNNYPNNCIINRSLLEWLYFLMANPGLFWFIFGLFKQKIYRKTVGFSRIQVRIDRTWPPRPKNDYILRRLIQITNCSRLLVQSFLALLTSLYVYLHHHQHKRLSHDGQYVKQERQKTWLLSLSLFLSLWACYLVHEKRTVMVCHFQKFFCSLGSSSWARRLPTPR